MIERFQSPITPILVVLCLLIILPSCSRLNYDIEPADDAGRGLIYHSMKIKAKLKETSSGHKQNIKILLKFTESKARMLFLGPPLNRVYAKLLTDGESALLINSRKKKYWQGDFKTLLQEMWDVDFSYVEFKRLLVEGIIPESRVKERGIKVRVEEETGGSKPGRIQITGRNIVIKLNISNRRIRRGKITFSINLNKLERTDLDRVLEND